MVIFGISVTTVEFFLLLFFKNLKKKADTSITRYILLAIFNCKIWFGDWSSCIVQTSGADGVAQA